MWIALFYGEGYTWQFLEKSEWPASGIPPQHPLRQAWSFIINHIREKAGLELDELIRRQPDTFPDLVAFHANEGIEWKVKQ